jgi:polyhydroxyalkanoate synthesis regulator phasin
VTLAEFLKKSVAFGVGAAAFSAEKMKQFADEMVAKGELTSDEANKFMDEMTTKADQEKKTIQDWMHEQMAKMLQQMGAAEAARVACLERRVAAIEAHIGLVVAEPEAEHVMEEELIPPADIT